LNEVERVFSENRDYLWGHCYRLLGVAADAEDVVQETFVRVLEKPPADTTRPWRPWLLTVASRLAIDQLRRRRRRGWVGPWLPEPIELGGEVAPEASAPAEQPAKAEQADSLSYAFLLALEALTPQQRAVLLLRDVQELSGAETAAALGIGESNVKVVLHRARKALAIARERSPFLDAAQKRRIGVALQRLLAALAAGDLPAVEAALAPDVRVMNDGNGHYHAAKKPVFGRSKVAVFLAKLRPRPGEEIRREIRICNGVPALYLERPDSPLGLAPRLVFLVDTDLDGQIREIYTVLAPEKLTRQRPARA
jgi:RNA polymerase sigma factor (sigma-70 family)